MHAFRINLEIRRFALYGLYIFKYAYKDDICDEDGTCFIWEYEDEFLKSVVVKTDIFYLTMKLITEYSKEEENFQSKHKIV